MPIVIGRDTGFYKDEEDCGEDTPFFLAYIDRRTFWDTLPCQGNDNYTNDGWGEDGYIKLAPLALIEWC